MRYRIVGLPGTGKTTKLISMVEEFLSDYSVRDIIYCSFTNAAVEEAMERVASKLKLDTKDMRWFRTLHSLSKKLLEIDKSLHAKRPASNLDIHQHYEEFKNRFGLGIIDQVSNPYIFGESYTEEEGLSSISKDALVKDPKNWLHGFGRYLITNHPHEFADTKKQKKIIVDTFERVGIHDFKSELSRKLRQYMMSWSLYKKSRKIFDFDKLLYDVYIRKLVPDARVLIIDEYQDSSYLQNLIIDQMGKHMDIVVVAGDPNQAIYGFQGSSPHYINEFIADRNILLSTSHRLPDRIVKYTRSLLENEWIDQLKSGVSGSGSVQRMDFTDIDFDDPEMRSIYILSRTNRMLSVISEQLNQMGVLHHNDEIGALKGVHRLISMILDDEEMGVNDLIFLDRPHQDISKVITLRSYQMLRDWMSNVREGKMLDGKKANITISGMTFLSFINRKKEPSYADLVRIFTYLVPGSEQTLLSLESVEPDQFDYQINRVKLMTIHRSKGKEADMVVIINLGSPYERSGGILDEEEEQRVYYVAATRARKRLVIADMEFERLEPTIYLTDPNKVIFPPIKI